MKVLRLSEVGPTRRALNYLALGIMAAAALSYCSATQLARGVVNQQVDSAEFQNTHVGNALGVYCGEVSGINGFGIRSPYERFVVDGSDVYVSDVSSDYNAFDSRWQQKCSPEHSVFNGFL